VKIAGLAALLGVLATVTGFALAKTAPPPPSGPPAPTILSHPANPTNETSASFAFGDSATGVSFQCKLDRGAYTACTSATAYNNLGLGEHEFNVRAIDKAGNASSATTFDWRITGQQAALPFAIEGNVPSSLQPGASPVAIPLRLSNPNHAPIVVTSLTVALQTSALPASCGAANFQLAQSNVSSANSIEVPANGSVTLPAGGASAPTIRMVETHTNQNSCEKATLWLSYAGSAHS
jgi:hypothetical protein